jgi:hypothetical protein
MSERYAREHRGGSQIDALAAGRAAARDRGMLRLRWLTRVAVVAATALVGLFAFVAAKALPGHKLHAPGTTASVRSNGVDRTSRNPSPDRAAPSLAPPPSLPAPSVQPPVVVSGGS